jgi:hypothetical protein
MQLPTRVVNPFPTLKFERTVFSFQNAEDRKRFGNKILEALLYMTCFFPFIQLVYIGSDTQPYGMLISLLVIGVYMGKERTMERRMVLLCMGEILMGAFALIGFEQISTYMVFRSYFTYASLLFIPYAVFLVMKRQGGMNDKMIKVFIWIWFFVGLVQKYVNKSFANGLLSRASTNATRGVVGLASEPSAYGYVCVFMILFALQFKKNELLYIGLCLVQILLFASSSVTVIYFAVYAVAYILNEILLRKKFVLVKITLLISCAAGGIYYIRNYVSRSSRIRILVDYMFDQPEFLLKDGSIRRRILAITDTMGSFIEHKGLPQGLSDYKWMSGIGGILVEGGFISVFILIIIGIIIWKGYPKETRIFYLLGFMIMMFSSITFSSPVVCFYIGYCAYQGWLSNEERNKIENTVDL